jgi:protease YdgD
MVPTAQAQGIRKDLPPELRPQNNVTSFHRRSVNSSEMPWRAIGRVNIGGRAHCSGTLVAPSIVLTAAHCVYSRTEKKLVSPGIVHFVAGYSKGEYQGHSKVSSYIIGTGFDGAKGPSKSNLPHDWALLTLNQPLGETIGFLTMPKSWSNAAPESAGKKVTLSITPDITTAGYPGDRSHVLSLEEDCRISATAIKGRVLFTDCIALKGDSGGPILQNSKGIWTVIGLQTSATNRNNKISGIGVSALAYREQLASLLSSTKSPSN